MCILQQHIGTFLFVKQKYKHAGHKSRVKAMNCHWRPQQTTEIKLGEIIYKSVISYQ